MSSNTTFNNNGNSTPTPLPNSNNSSSSISSSITELKKFIVENGDHLSLARNIIYFLPGRYGDSELNLEGLNSIVNLFQSSIDLFASKIMLSHNKSKTSEEVPVPPPYYLDLLSWIVCIQNIELFVEVFASTRSDDKSKYRWPAIICIEAIKSFLRIKLLFRTNGNMLVHHSFHVPSKDIKALADSQSNPIISQNNLFAGKRKTLHDKLKGESEKNVEEDSTLIPLLPPCAPIDRNTKIISELLFILRPLVYAITRWTYGKKSWTPWLLSLAMEYTSLGIGEYGSVAYKLPPTKLESDEVKRRRSLFKYYLLRSPFYDRFIGDGIVLKILNYFKKIPILKIVIVWFLNYINAYRTRYFYTSAS